jgi:hypothetical protein
MIILPASSEIVKPSNNHHNHIPGILLKDGDKPVSCLHFDGTSGEFSIAPIANSVDAGQGSNEIGKSHFLVYSKMSLSKSLENTDINTGDIKLVFSFGELQKTLICPDIFINEDYIPIIIMPRDMEIDDINSKKYKYKIEINQKLFEVQCLRLLIDQVTMVFIPLTILEISKDETEKIINYSSKIIYLFGKQFEISYPTINTNNGKTCFVPETLSIHRPYLNTIYLDAALMYLTTDKSLRNVSELIRKKYNLSSNQFSHSTLSRYLKKILITDKNIDRDEIDNIISNSEEFNSIKPIDIFQKKKLLTKMRYNWLLCCHNYINNSYLCGENSSHLESLHSFWRPQPNKKILLWLFKCNKVVG